MNTLTHALGGIADGIGPFLILLGILIFVHELGHFLVAKYFKVRVETFSLGFGRKILQYKKGDTNYCISLIPLGGYVKMFGDDPTKDIPEEEKKHSFLHKPVSQRIAIVLAGPLMNLFFAFFLFLAIGLIGEPMMGNYLGDVPTASRAHEAGFRSGDKVVSIDGKEMESWSQVKSKINSSTNQKLHFQVQREFTGESAEVQVTPVLGDNDNILSKQTQVGVIEGLDSLSFAPMIGVTSPDSDAAKAGLQSLELITNINGQEIQTWRDLEHQLQINLEKEQGPLTLKVQAYGSDDKPTTREVTLTPTKGATTVASIGLEPAQLYLWKVKRDSPAEKAGLKPGDRVVSVDGQEITAWSQVIEQVKKFNPDRPAPEFVFRRGHETLKAQIVPELTALIDTRGKDERRFTIGIVSGVMQTTPSPVLYKPKGVGELLTMGVNRTMETNSMVVMSIVRLIQGDVSAKNIGGIISIGRFANQSYEAGLVQFLRMMALISVNLFLLNLLPVPVLDGGHLVFFTIEALRGAPLSMRKMEIAQTVGLVLLMSLMAFALFNDISNWLNSLW